jgi:hypothetical protein
MIVEAKTVQDGLWCEDDQRKMGFYRVGFDSTTAFEGGVPF